MRVDASGTPRLERVLTPVLQMGGLVRMRGKGIDGGVQGAPQMVGSLYRGGGQLVVGVCGEKDCAPSNLGVETIGCLARVGGSGDAVAGQDSTVAYAFSDTSNFGCKLDGVAGNPAGGFFNLTLHEVAGLHRGARTAETARAPPVSARLAQLSCERAWPPSCCAPHPQATRTLAF